MPAGQLGGPLVGLGVLFVRLAGVDLGQRPLRASERAFDLVGGRYPHDVLLALAGLGRGDLANVGGRVRPSGRRSSWSGSASSTRSSSVIARCRSSSATAVRWAVSQSSAVTTGSGSVSLAWRSARTASASSALARVTAVWASQTARASSSSCSCSARRSRVAARAAASVASRCEPGVLGGVGGRVGFGATQGGGLVVVRGGLAGSGELVADVAGSPGLFALPAAHPHAQLPVGLLVDGPVDLGAAEGPPGGAVGGVVLDLPGLRRGAEGVGLVVVAAQLPVGGDDACALLPGVAFDQVVRDGAERVDGPFGPVVGGGAAELGGALVRGARRARSR